MNRAAQRNTVPNGIGTTISHRTNMRGLGFAAATAVDEFQTCDGARGVVSSLYGDRECGVAKRPRDQTFDDRSLIECRLLHYAIRRQFRGARIGIDHGLKSRARNKL